LGSFLALLALPVAKILRREAVPVGELLDRVLEVAEAAL
jgi:hypothetical protein